MKKGKSKKAAEVVGESTEGDTSEPSPSFSRSKKRNKISAYEQAKRVYERIQQQKAQEKTARQVEREKRQAMLDKYLRSKKEMNKALRKCNKKGQPNLGAQMEVLLKKIEKNVEKG
uniref:rRNA-processing protein FYV7 n=1 Tax=Haemonchus contortus TaxID=6289 RepID=A0A7I4YEN6_HAECO|nr:thyroid transcription factor 1-associated [Haemonchus contortus]